MAFRWKICGLTWTFLVLVASISALDWKATTLAVTALPFQSELDAVFEFTNRSSHAVTISEVETSCSCLNAVSSRKAIAPGDSGTIKAHFTVGDRGGVYDRSVMVVTDESDSPVRLILKVEIPDVASVTPRTVSWRIGESPTEKSVEVKSAEAIEITFSKAEPTSEAYSARLETVVAGHHYRLHVRPDSTASPVSAAIRVFGREKSGHEVVLSAYASVR